ncbi:putative lysine decarboxylase family protein [Asticcacaulis biprosthecium C19]|uniref:Cytokinin riboside 5'-monophosphate phosphoribohydrolase n=1 Tax=Asticcacaulis biprosthecium C19 TaxID=715226 RepID=F4QQ56_9CAUL|nr:TIGR00730 family Rossman fold protein [Asticcacaulis biprosthecium]EGF90343.1 putative lysine decarboxylase family protein [Asticcacaulis biprosthecium C19]
MPLSKSDIKSVCVFCGSSFGNDPSYRQAALDLGQVLAGAGLRLVYGGGGVGLMGETARAVHDAGGKVLGIMPQFLRSREIVYDDVETRMVTNMHERKMMMFEESDAFIVLPGGVGTLEEVIELMSWRRLDLHKKPVIFLNVNGFWDPFFALIDHTLATEFTPTSFRNTYHSVDTVEGVLPAIAGMATVDVDIDTRRVV